MNLELKNAIENENIEKIKEMLKLSDINVQKGFENACKYGCPEIVKIFLSLEGNNRVDVHENNILGMTCQKGHLDIVKLLLSLEGDRRIDVHWGDEDAFMTSCFDGKTKIVKLLLSLEGDRKIDVHTDNEFYLRALCDSDLCRHKEIKIIKLLLSLDGDRKLDIHRNDDEIFKLACKNGHLKTVKLLLMTKEKFDLSVKTSFYKINRLLSLVKNPIDFSKELLRYQDIFSVRGEKEIQLMCVKQTLLNLCFVIEN